MKSVIIKQHGKTLLHIKRTKDGVVADCYDGTERAEITVILKDNSRIKLGGRK